MHRPCQHRSAQLLLGRVVERDQPSTCQAVQCQHHKEKHHKSIMSISNQLEAYCIPPISPNSDWAAMHCLHSGPSQRTRPHACERALSHTQARMQCTCKWMNAHTRTSTHSESLTHTQCRLQSMRSHTRDAVSRDVKSQPLCCAEQALEYQLLPLGRELVHPVGPPGDTDSQGSR